MAAKKGEIVFHRNGDLLDCRRENMVVVEKDEYRSMVYKRTRKSALGYPS
jgi:hypothetical protein